MSFLIQVSMAVKPFPESELVNRLAVGGRNQAGTEIAGLLFERDDKFKQLL
jgi:hypothetical protein